jgi:hypothetical protein
VSGQLFDITKTLTVTIFVGQYGIRRTTSKDAEVGA